MVRCERPTPVTTQQGNQYLPCNECPTCLSKVVRSRIGLAFAEQRRPQVRAHLDPRMQHKIDLTYAKPPMTVPVPHRLGVAFNPLDGTSKLWAGVPYDGHKRGVYRRNGQLVYADAYDAEDYTPLTEDQCADEFVRVYTQRYHWTERDVARYNWGDYDPMPTCRYRDLVLFNKRVREHLDRKFGIQQMRFIGATEVGDAFFRPHIHEILLGIPAGVITDVYALWSDYQPREEGAGTPGHIYPWFEDALKGATIIEANAGAYALKDVAKSRYLYNRSPEMLGVERPRVDYSKRPPFGERFRREVWMRKQILPKYQADLKRLDELEAVIKLRENALAVRVQLRSGNWDQFPTVPRWRSLIRKDLKIPDDLWRESGDEMKRRNAANLEEVLNDDESAQALKADQEALRDRSREIRKRRAERTAKRRQRLVAAGKFQSD